MCVYLNYLYVCMCVPAGCVFTCNLCICAWQPAVLCTSMHACMCLPVCVCVCVCVFMCMCVCMCIPALPPGTAEASESREVISSLMGDLDSAAAHTENYNRLDQGSLWDLGSFRPNLWSPKSHLVQSVIQP